MLMSDPPKRVVGRPFVKGQITNPGGRARGADRQFREWLKESHDDKTRFQVMLDRLDSIIRTGEDKDALAAIKFVMERGFGMPKAHVELSAGLTDEQRAEELRILATETLAALPIVDVESVETPMLEEKK